MRDEVCMKSMYEKPVQQHLRTESLLVYGCSNKIVFFPPRIAEACVRFKNVPHYFRFVFFSTANLFEIINNYRKMFSKLRSQKVVWGFAGWWVLCTMQESSEILVFCEAFYERTQSPTYYYQQTTINDLHPQTVDASATLTSGGQITVVGWESSNCRDFSTTAYFST